MRVKIFAFIWFAALAAAPITLSADNACCDTPAAACCDKPAMACCDKPAAETNAPAATCCQKADKHQHDGQMACCQNGKECDMPCCADGACEMPCCNDKADLDVIEMFFAMDGQRIVPTDASVAPTKQTASVFFQRPVWFGETVLMGRYIIEHDTERQARGEPCTHIYAAGDSSAPVVTFHCTHLDANAADTAVVVLQSNPDGSQKFLQFQFSGETAAHGYPTR
jgi:hypothetical protein